MSQTTMSQKGEFEIGDRRNRLARMKCAALVIAAGTALAGGCSSGPASLQMAGSPSYLGGPAAAPTAPATEPRVSSGKVLSAIVFERVTGLEVDPSRLIDR